MTGLSDASLLISFDPLTNLNYEATLLGVPVYIIEDYYGLISNTYFKYYGITNKEDVIAVSSKEVGKAWSQYKRWINEQEYIVQRTMTEIITHFNRISGNDSLYIDSVKARNVRQKEIDKSLYLQKKSKIFLNIYLPEDIPAKIRVNLGISGSGEKSFLCVKIWVKKIIYRLHLLNFAKKIKEKVVVNKTLREMKKR